MSTVVERSSKVYQKENPIDKLKKLSELYEASVISKEVYKEKKEKLLEQI